MVYLAPIALNTDESVFAQSVAPYLSPSDLSHGSKTRDKKVLYQVLQRGSLSTLSGLDYLVACRWAALKSQVSITLSSFLASLSTSFSHALYPILPDSASRRSAIEAANASVKANKRVL